MVGPASPASTPRASAQPQPGAAIVRGARPGQQRTRGASATSKDIRRRARACSNGPVLSRACTCSAAAHSARAALAATRQQRADPSASGRERDDAPHYALSLSDLPARAGGRARIVTPPGVSSIPAPAKRTLRHSHSPPGLRVRRSTSTACALRRSAKLIIYLDEDAAAHPGRLSLYASTRPPPDVDRPDRSKEGWIDLPDGGAVALGEPVGMAAWLP